MGKKSKKKQKKREKGGGVEIAVPVVKPSRREWVPVVLVPVLALVLYANTAWNEFAIDDKSIILENRYTLAGFSGLPDLLTTPGMHGKDGRVDEQYRPLSMATHAVVCEFFGTKPAPAHFLNILLFALAGMMLFLFLRRLLGDSPPLLAFFAALLFVAHPIHTEVVANVKGRDEILALLNALAAGWFLLVHVDRGKKGALVLSAVFFFLAISSKESAITFLGIFPLALWMFRGAKPSAILRVCAPLLVAAGAYLAIRHFVVYAPLAHLRIPMAEKLDNPLLYVGAPERVATACTVIVRYVGLLALPHPLVSDYSYNQVPIVSWSDAFGALSILFCAGLVLVAAWCVRKRPLVGFGMMFFLVTLSIVSNLFIGIGTIMGERLLFVPSIGFCLLFAGLLRRLPVPGILVVIVLSLYGYKTVTRNMDWKDDRTLSSRDIHHSPGSSKLQLVVGTFHYEDGRYREALELFDRSVEIYDQNEVALVWRGMARGRLQDGAGAAESFHAAMAVNPGYYDAHYQLGVLYVNRKDYRSAISCFEKARKLQPGNPNAREWLDYARNMRDRETGGD